MTGVNTAHTSPASPVPEAAARVQFTCEIEAGTDALVIKVGLRNLDDVDYGIFDRITTCGPDGRPNRTRDQAFVELHDTVVLVRKLALPVPPGLEAPEYIVPSVSRLPPGSEHAESFRLPCPLRLMQPVRRALLGGEQAEGQVRDAHWLMVAVGIFPLIPPLVLVPEDPADPAILTASPLVLARIRQQVVYRTFRLETPIPVLDDLPRSKAGEGRTPW